MRFLSSVSFRVQTVETKFDDREISTIKYKVFFSYTVLPPHPSGRKTYIKKERKKIISAVHARVDDIQSDSINFSSGTAPRHPGKSCVPTAVRQNVVVVVGEFLSVSLYVRFRGACKSSGV